MHIGVDVTCDISETGGMPTKFGVHACYINPYEIWLFLKVSHISKTGEATPTKIGVHAHYIIPYVHEFFEPIPIN